MPIVDRSQAKEGGFDQVRKALDKFVGTVTGAEFDMWGGNLVDEETGKKRQPREFLEITTTDNEVLESNEELTMDISEEYSFRVNCSDFKGSFWIDMFLASTDQHKLLVPDDLVGKRIVFEKMTLEAEDPKYNSTNFIVADVVKAESKSSVTKKKTVKEEKESSDEPVEGDPMELALQLAVGKSEAQFKVAVATHPDFANSPLLSIAKQGLLTQALVSEGKLIVDDDGKYQIPD